MNGTFRIVSYEVLWMKNVAAFVRKFFYEFWGLSVTKCWMTNVAAFVRKFLLVSNNRIKVTTIKDLSDPIPSILWGILPVKERRVSTSLFCSWFFLFCSQRLFSLLFLAKFCSSFWSYPFVILLRSTIFDAGGGDFHLIPNFRMSCLALTIAAACVMEWSVK